MPACLPTRARSRGSHRVVFGTLSDIYDAASGLMFCSIHDFTFLMTDIEIKGQVSFEFSEKKKLLPARFAVKFMLLPQSIAQVN